MLGRNVAELTSLLRKGEVKRLTARSAEEAYFGGDGPQKGEPHELSLDSSSACVSHWTSCLIRFPVALKRLSSSPLNQFGQWWTPRPMTWGPNIFLKIEFRFSLQRMGQSYPKSKASMPRTNKAFPYNTENLPPHAHAHQMNSLFAVIARLSYCNGIRRGLLLKLSLRRRQ